MKKHNEYDYFGKSSVHTSISFSRGWKSQVNHVQRRCNFPPEVLILPSEVRQSNLCGQSTVFWRVLFSCPSSQVVNLWVGYHLQKICNTPSTWFPIEKKRCNKATCLFQVSITTVEAFSMVMHFIHKRCLLAASQTLRSCFTVPDGCERATGNFHCKQCYLLMYNMRLQIKIDNNKSGFKQV